MGEIESKGRKALSAFCALISDLDGNDLSAKLVFSLSLAPHKPEVLPKGKMAVYGFFHGSRCLKIGKAGPKTGARYRHHHYRFETNSSLALSIERYPSEVGLSEFSRPTAANWMCENLTRIAVIVPASESLATLSLLEAVLQFEFQPIFEGRRIKQYSPP